MNIKINGLLIAFVILLIFPFVYFYYSIKDHVINSPQIAYPIIIVLGLFLALYTERSLRNKIKQETKHSLFIVFAVLVVLYAAFLFLMTWSRYSSFVSEAIDVVYFHQVIWQL